MVHDSNTSKHTSQFQFSEVLVEAGVWLETRVSLFQDVKSHLKAATYEPSISLFTLRVLPVLSFYLEKKKLLHLIKIVS